MAGALHREDQTCRPLEILEIRKGALAREDLRWMMGMAEDRPWTVKEVDNEVLRLKAIAAPRLALAMAVFRMMATEEAPCHRRETGLDPRHGV